MQTKQIQKFGSRANGRPSCTGGHGAANPGTPPASKPCKPALAERPPPSLAALAALWPGRSSTRQAARRCPSRPFHPAHEKTPKEDPERHVNRFPVSKRSCDIGKQATYTSCFISTCTRHFVPALPLIFSFHEATALWGISLAITCNHIRHIRCNHVSVIPCTHLQSFAFRLQRTGLHR